MWIEPHIHLNANKNGPNIQYPMVVCVLCNPACVFSLDINNLELPVILVDLNCSCFCIPRQRAHFTNFPAN
jgi:hypothetical protein